MLRKLIAWAVRPAIRKYLAAKVQWSISLNSDINLPNTKAPRPMKGVCDGTPMDVAKYITDKCVYVADGLDYYSSVLTICNNLYNEHLINDAFDCDDFANLFCYLLITQNIIGVHNIRLANLVDWKVKLSHTIALFKYIDYDRVVWQGAFDTNGLSWWRQDVDLSEEQIIEHWSKIYNVKNRYLLVVECDPVVF